MNDLSNSIFAYYTSRLGELSAYKQFHFASRLYLWDRRPNMRKTLDELRPWFTADSNIAEALHLTKQRAIATPDFGSKNARALRSQYFDQYPMLTDYIPVLLHLLYLQTVYGIDNRNLFDSVFPSTEVDDCFERLMADEAAIAMLSSQAINGLYTWAYVRDTTLSPQQFLRIGQSRYDRDDPVQLQLLVYLYTHCIIGASLYYYRPVPPEHLAVYMAMVSELEAILEANFDRINLDNKFEFLVSSLVLGKHSHLEDRVFAEAATSISLEGNFLVDRHNKNPQTNNTSFEKSEHRNVLFLLSTSEFHSRTA